MNRRFFLQRLICSALLATGYKTTTYGYYNWADLFRVQRAQGTAQVLFRAGLATNQTGLLQTGDSLPSVNELFLGFSGRLLLLMPDGSLLFLRGKAKVELQLGLSNGAKIKLFQGAMQLITNSSYRTIYPYLISTNLYNFGIKDAICYLEEPLDEPIDRLAIQQEFFTFAPEKIPPSLLLEKQTSESANATMASKPNEESAILLPQSFFQQLPQTQDIPTTYACTCHGFLELIDQGWNRGIGLFQGDRHLSQFIQGNNETLAADIMHHDNLLISKLHQYFQEGQHSLEWMNPKPTKDQIDAIEL